MDDKKRSRAFNELWVAFMLAMLVGGGWITVKLFSVIRLMPDATLEHPNTD
jgi:hypothetical protein